MGQLSATQYNTSKQQSIATTSNHPSSRSVAPYGMKTTVALQNSLKSKESHVIKERKGAIVTKATPNQSKVSDSSSLPATLTHLNKLDFSPLQSTSNRPTEFDSPPAGLNHSKASDSSSPLSSVLGGIKSNNLPDKSQTSKEQPKDTPRPEMPVPGTEKKGEEEDLSINKSMSKLDVDDQAPTGSNVKPPNPPPYLPRKLLILYAGETGRFEINRN
jgi:hypothetical protein